MIYKSNIFYYPMNKTFIMLILIVGLISCSDSIKDDLNDVMPEMKSTIKYNEHFVSYDDIVALNNSRNSTRAATDSTLDIECLTNYTNDTLLYVYNKQDGGWIIYSSDKRVPPIVAQSENGSFEELMQIEGAKLWVQSIADDLETIRRLDDDKLNFSQEEIEGNKAFWKSVSSPDEFVKGILQDNSTRGFNDPNNPIIPIGHYEYSYSITYSEVYDSISRLTTTNWDQGIPYNLFCPYKSDSCSRAPAGCAAIAGAQMLYFLHYHFGVPETAPSAAYCYGTVDAPNHDYDWAQTDYNSTVWNYMNDYELCAAPLIANVGLRVGMVYGNNGSSAYFSDLPNNVFAPYGITCTYSSYNVENLRTSLSNGLPVLLSACSLNPPDNGMVGHGFIADRYKRARLICEEHYEWVYDYIPEGNGNSQIILPEEPEQIVYTYFSPYITMIGMNWGWGEYYNDPTQWFALTGDWIANNTSYNWNLERYMIYNFQVAENN